MFYMALDHPLLLRQPRLAAVLATRIPDPEELLKALETTEPFPLCEVENLV